MKDVSWVKELVESGMIEKKAEVYTYSGNANRTRLAIGYPTLNAGTGVIDIFDLTSCAWQKTKRITPFLHNSKGFLGSSIDMSSDGNRLVASIAADNINEKPGVVVYKYTNVWVLEQLISNQRHANIKFGHSVAISGNGLLIAIACPLTNTCKDSKPGVYLYVHNGIDRYLKKQVLHSTVINCNTLGQEVKISRDGSTIVVYDSKQNNTRFSRPNKSFMEVKPF